MSDKKRYEVVLAEDVDKDAFVAEFSGVVDIASTLQYVPRCLIIDMTDSQKDVLEADSRVQEVDWIFREERNVMHDGYNEIVQSKKPTISTSGWASVDGTEYISLGIAKAAGIDTSTLTSSGKYVGCFDTATNLVNGAEEDSVADNNATIKQSFDGSTVDIVILEPEDNNNNTLMSNNSTHPNFLKPSDNSFKIVPMDWSNYDGSVTSADNNQVSNTNYVHEHAVASAMAAAGTYTGWAKNSDVRLIYLDGTTSGLVNCLNAIVAWHLTKSVNPATGRRNATIINNSWSWNASTIYEYYIPIDLITSFTWHTRDGTQTTENKPGPNWNNDFTPFHRGGHAVWQVETPGSPGNYQWCIKSGQDTRGSFSVDLAWENLNTYEGIYSFSSAGNTPETYRADDVHGQWNNQIFTSAGNIIAISTAVNGGLFTETLSLENRVTTSSFYCHRDGYNHETAIVVGSTNPSSLHNVLGESYGQGPLVDTYADSRLVYSSVSNYGNAVNDINGYVWSYYSGTSASCPQVAGGAALLVEYFYNKKGAWPTIAELRALIQEASDSVDYAMLDEPKLSSTSAPYDWSTAGTASFQFPSIENMYESNFGNTTRRNVGDNSQNYNVNRVRSSDLNQDDWTFANNSQAYYTRAGKRMFALPWRYRVVPEFASEPVRTNVYQNRPTSGQTYPRRKIRLG